jgi:hypothetical protein
LNTGVDVGNARRVSIATRLRCAQARDFDLAGLALSSALTTSGGKWRSGQCARVALNIFKMLLFVLDNAFPNRR